MVCLAVYIQQILEQYSMPLAGSREPAHLINTFSLVNTLLLQVMSSLTIMMGSSQNDIITTINFVA